MAISNVRSIQVNLGADVSNFTTNIRNASRTITSLQSELRNNISRINASTNLMVAQMGNAGNSMAQLQARASGLGRTLQMQSSYVSRLESELNSARAQFGNASTEVRRLELNFLRAATAEQRMRNELTSVNTELARLRQQTSLIGRMGGIGQQLEGLRSTGMTAAMSITLPVTLGLKKGIDYNAFMESNEAQFAVMMKSAEKASDYMDKLQKMAIVTPFETKDLAQNAKLLMAYGVSANNAIPIMSRLGDVAGTNKQKFNSLSLALGQVYARGKLTGDNARQLTEAGFSPLQIMAEKTGKSFSYFQEKMENGEISVKDTIDALVTATDKGGLFFENMKTQSKTFEGQMSTLRDNISITFGAMTKPLFDALTQLLPTINRFMMVIANFAQENPKIAALGLIFVGLAAAIGPALIGVSFLGSAMRIASSGATMLTTAASTVITALKGVSLASVATGARIAGMTATALIFAASIFVIYDNWGKMPAWFDALLTNIGNGFKLFGNLVLTTIAYVANEVVGFLRNIFNFAKNTFAGLNDILGRIPKIGIGFKLAANEIRGISNPFEKFYNVTDAVLTEADSRLKESTANMKKSGAKLDELTAGLFENYSLDAIKEKFSGIGQDLVDDMAVSIGDITDIPGLEEGLEDKKKKIEDVIKDMVGRIQSQAKSFRDALGLFDKIAMDKISGERLFARLDTQVKMLDKWKTALDKLKGKLGGNSALFQELLAKGPASAGQIIGLSQLSDTKLDEYSKLYAQKSSIAMGAATTAVTGQMIQEKKVENITLQITGNTITTDNIDDLVNKIVGKLKSAGVM